MPRAAVLVLLLSVFASAAPAQDRDIVATGGSLFARLLNSGPYFGTARAGWVRDMTPAQIYAEVDHWVERGLRGLRGLRGFKAKGIAPEQLHTLIERAHFHGLTVTGHVDSGNRNSVNPRDAILVGVDRIEHFVCGDALVADRSAYASFDYMTFDTPEFRRIAALYRQHHANCDAQRRRLLRQG